MTKLKEVSLRPIEMRNGSPLTGLKGVFHHWCTEPFYSDIQGCFARTYAIVELSDGNVHLVEPSHIRFLDIGNTGNVMSKSHRPNHV